MQIKDLAKHRYSITYLRNDAISPTRRPSWAVCVALNMSFTYRDLVKSHTEHLQSQRASLQVQRNHRTALNRWMQAFNRSEHDYIGDEFVDARFKMEVDEHITSSELSKRSARDRRSILAAWQVTYLSLCPAAASASRPSGRVRDKRPPDVAMSPFERRLKEALAVNNMSAKRAARLSGISFSALRRWARGGLPNERSRPTLTKLEQFLKLTPGTLQEAWQESSAQLNPASKDRYSERLRKNTAASYRLSTAHIPEPLLQEWQALLRYKTGSGHGATLKKGGSKWSLVHPEASTSPVTPLNEVDGMVSPAAGVAWSHVSSYLGYLTLSRERGGAGLKLTDSLSLAWLAVPERIASFLRFMTNRSDGLMHSGHAVLCAQVASLLNPKTGFLGRQTDFHSKLPFDETQGRGWLELCEQTRELVISFSTECQDKSRRPDAAIRGLLDSPMPLRPILQAVQKLQQIAKDTPTDTTGWLVAKRDALLLGLLISNPLRLKHWVTMTVTYSSRGCLERTTQGSWKFNIPGRHFKNRRRVGKQPYLASLPAWLHPMLDEYILRVRPKLLGSSQCQEFFLNTKGARFSTLSKHLKRLTQRLIPNTGGFGAHAFRHLVATDWLTTYPNDFLTVAELLNDSLNVVMRDYAHLKKDTAFSRYEAHVLRQLPDAF